ncbi:MAG: carbohydrate ABC transporter substrate-binding protein [Oscillospiraceae bacterium]|nr:carbohydrate ABC transporter substrate-binding protein [Oscillospiraceae bacterium]
MMRMMKKVLAGIMGVAMLASMTACSSEGTTDEGGAADGTVAGASEGPVTLKFSWWGGDSRHEATQKAVEAFMAKYDNITVETNFGAWSGWEDSMSTAFYAGTAPDVNQVNWNWISNYSADGSIFLDMNKVSNTFDLTQYDQSALDQCTVAGELQAIPVSMTGRIFYWNESTFEKAGISTPKTLEELYAAGETFKTVLGDDYYPLALGEYDRAILCVYYLESVYGKAWVTDGKLNYTAEEIATGLQFIEDLEAKHVIPTVATILGDGAESLDKNPKWMEGKYAGIFEWDSSATKFGGALNEGQNFIVGDYMTDMGEYQGGFSKVSLAFAITENTKYPTESAMLMQYLLNDPEGTAIMASERGIPLSKAANATCTEKGLLNEMVAEANSKVLAWVDFPLDTQFENSKLKGAPDGVYYDVFGGLSYDEYTVEDAAKVLVDGVTAVLEG